MKVTGNPSWFTLGEFVNLVRRDRDSHSHRVTSELLSWKFKGSQNTCVVSNIWKVKQHHLSWECTRCHGAELHWIKLQVRGTSQRKTHLFFPTSTLPSAKWVKRGPPLGGSKADSLHAALPRQRTQVVHPSLPPVSNSRAQRLEAVAGLALGDSTACDSPTQHGSRRRNSRSSTWAVLSRAPDPSCPEQNGQ